MKEVLGVFLVIAVPSVIGAFTGLWVSYLL